MGAGGGVAFGGGHHFGSGDAAAGRSPPKSAYRIELDALYGEGWETRALKTLAQELRDRGLEPRSGDDKYEVVPKPRLIGDRVSLAMTLALIAFLALCGCWAWYEFLPDANSPFYTQRTR